MLEKHVFVFIVDDGVTGYQSTWYYIREN